MSSYHDLIVRHTNLDRDRHVQVIIASGANYEIPQEEIAAHFSKPGLGQQLQVLQIGALTFCALVRLASSKTAIAKAA
jgi:hypothetical protein